jgi:putative transposase
MTKRFYRRNRPRWQPHWQPRGRAVFVTWRIFGSLPAGFSEHVKKWSSTPQQEFLDTERLLDAAVCGPHWLSDPEIADIAEQAILSGESVGHYALRSYVVMPNHVHVLLEPLMPLQSLTCEIKGVSARFANAKLGRSGQHFWQDESFDHWIRNSCQLARTKAYIENNPVKAHLRTRPEDWPWSSVHE